MSLGALYQQDIDRALDTRARAPIEPAKPNVEERSLWGTALRGVAAGASQFFADVTSLRMQDDPAERQAVGRRMSLASDEAQRVTDQQRATAEASRAVMSTDARDYAASLKPDPSTAGLAENLVFQATRGLSKAAGAVVALGPVGGAAAFGGSEAAATFDELKREGVDPVTAGKAAAVSGVASAAGVLLPMVGPTIKSTLGLYAIGGPGAFVAQQQATRKVLEAADYNDLAQRFDPLDPVGLAVSALMPLPFAAWGIRGNLRAARAKAAADAAPVSRLEPTLEPAPAAAAVPEAPTARATPEQIDAAMVHNLTLVREATRAAAPADLPTLTDILPPAAIDGATPATRAARVAADLADIPPAVRPAPPRDFGPLADTVAAARSEVDAFRAAGGDLGQFLGGRNVAPEVQNLVVGMVENATSPRRLDALMARVAEEAARPAKAAMDATADAVDGMRALTREQLAQIEQPPAKSADPLTQAVADRVTALEASVPKLTTRLDADGRAVSLAEDLAVARREAAEGTDVELGTMDADLVRVAAQCALSIGAA